MPFTMPASIVFLTYTADKYRSDSFCRDRLIFHLKLYGYNSPVGHAQNRKKSGHLDTKIGRITP